MSERSQTPAAVHLCENFNSVEASYNGTPSRLIITVIKSNVYPMLLIAVIRTGQNLMSGKTLYIVGLLLSIYSMSLYETFTVHVVISVVIKAERDIAV